MDYKIVSFEAKYLEEMAKLFSLVYSDETGVYPVDLAKKRLEDDLKTGFDYSFVAIDENNKVLGGIICKKIWEESGWGLYVDTVQVSPQHQKHGVGRLLMTAAINKAKENGAATVGFPVDKSEEFRTQWYESMGFARLPKWTYYWSKIGDLKI